MLQYSAYILRNFYFPRHHPCHTNSCDHAIIVQRIHAYVCKFRSAYYNNVFPLGPTDNTKVPDPVVRKLYKQ